LNLESIYQSLGRCQCLTLFILRKNESRETPCKIRAKTAFEDLKRGKSEETGNPFSLCQASGPACAHERGGGIAARFVTFGATIRAGGPWPAALGA
jgi:hypothetical protein